MYQLVKLNRRLSTKCFITQITGIRTLAAMCKLVCLHMRHATECFFTHIT
jgi:hypothetical protein